MQHQLLPIQDAQTQLLRRTAPRPRAVVESHDFDGALAVREHGLQAHLQLPEFFHIESHTMGKMTRGTVVVLGAYWWDASKMEPKKS